jgi:O-acetyl-ADP-ribose deacetylase (regulator of RNase III)
MPSSTVSPYAYQLYDVNLGNQAENPDVLKLLKEFFVESKHAKNVIYPTHDKKCYVNFERDNFLRFKEMSDIQRFVINSKDNRVVLIQCDHVDTGCSLFGLHKLKNSSNQQLYEQMCGLEIVELNDVMLVKMDSYQKSLIDFLEASSQVTNAPIRVKQVKLLAEKDKSLIYEYTGKNVVIEINQDNLLEQRVDVIVNAANVYLNFGGGVAGAIFDRCGKVIDDECQLFLRKQSRPMRISEVMHTKAYALNQQCKYVVHACGPRWSDYSKQDKNLCFLDLKATFLNTLNHVEAELSDAKSIAIPLISSGIFGVPRQVCCRALKEAIEEYVELSDSKFRLKQIKLTNIDKETFLELLDFFKVNLNFDIENNLKRMSLDNKAESASPKEESKRESCWNCSDKERKSIKSAPCKCLYCSDCNNELEQSHDNKCFNPDCWDKLNKNNSQK